MADAVATADVDRIFSLTPFGIGPISLPEHLSNTHRPPPMSHTQPGISAVILNTFLDLLIPLFLTAAGGDPDTARAAALELLADFNPRSPRELDLATQAIGNGMTSLTMLGKTTEGGLSLDDINGAIKSATSLARAGHQAERRLEDLQTTRRIAASRQQPEEEGPPAPAPAAVPDLALSTPAPVPDTPPPTTPEQAAEDLAAAETALARAEAAHHDAEARQGRRTPAHPGRPATSRPAPRRRSRSVGPRPGPPPRRSHRTTRYHTGSRLTHSPEFDTATGQSA